ncbi:hypothetical protein PHYPSEUDO_001599 [Phytophthora pseudosyringae]|uniref:Uncharacterized protein n=1 Tax=Phytophthora pseudosyringae TaxID=221518 RepID=A0A8T1V511_9STRA|nr:hypothetical protein PHYPSEUDO_001599 [Phytophthora pseudosyringae]
MWASRQQALSPWTVRGPTQFRYVDTIELLALDEEPGVTVTLTSSTEATDDGSAELEGCDEVREPDPEAENASKTAANDTEPVPDAEAEADNASMIASIDPDPETNDADAEPERRTTVGPAAVGRGVPFLVMMAPDDPHVLAMTARLARSTFSHAILQRERPD